MSCIARAGWFAGMLSASKLCQSSSTSGPSSTREAGIAEQRLDPAARARDRVQPARLLAAPGLRDVDAAGRELALEFRLLERRLPRAHQRR